MLGLGVAIGRYATPAKVLTVVKVETVIKEVKIKERQRNVTTHTRTVITPTPAGPVTTTETDTRSATQTETRTDTAASTSSVTTKLVEGHKPDWRISAMGGVLIMPGTQPSWLAGGLVERRILGPISIGAWGLGGPKAGVAGLTLGVEF